MSSRQLQEYHALFAVQAEERGELPPPEPEHDEDDEPDPDEPTDEDVDALVKAELERVKGLQGNTDDDQRHDHNRPGRPDQGE